MWDRYNDGYISARLQYARPSWTLGFNWLQDGVAKEQGWSADLAATVWGRDIRVEYAQQLKDYMSRDVDDGKALMVSADLWRTNRWRLSGYYSEADWDYNIYYSALNPYYENLDRGLPATAVPWEKWLRNPLVESNVRVLGGQLDIQIGSIPFTIAYFDRDLKQGAGELPYNALWAVSIGKQIADGISANLTYARQQGSAAAYEDRQLLQASVSVGF